MNEITPEVLSVYVDDALFYANEVISCQRDISVFMNLAVEYRKDGSPFTDYYDLAKKSLHLLEFLRAEQLRTENEVAKLLANKTLPELADIESCYFRQYERYKNMLTCEREHKTTSMFAMQEVWKARWLYIRQHIQNLEMVQGVQK